MTYYIGAMAVGSNDILHYGVKGMKWGVRRYEYDGARGLRRRHAVRVASRLQQINADVKRKSQMNVKQRESLKRATKYWDERARGEKPTSRRGFIRRSADAYRSYSLKERAAYQGVNAALNTGVSVARGKSLGLEKKYGQIALRNASSAAVSLGYDEVFNRLFGHF